MDAKDEFSVKALQINLCVTQKSEVQTFCDLKWDYVQNHHKLKILKGENAFKTPNLSTITAWLRLP